MPPDPLIAIVFSALGAEAFINGLFVVKRGEVPLTAP
jgi:hypothetical protein